eukprot:TRINITY_DN19557_c0_g3_i1.p1 TRINITY_DN19557_c0_g3~~TRINITY_DN19557_c0_g3_i1.p1  ORF type:complete len:436 (+),score=156.64 TRINITY_DN19557_c0_g3_i1:84-1310(+)
MSPQAAALVDAALAAGEWKEETKQGSGRKWYWRRGDRMRVRSREELAAVLVAEAAAPAPSAAPTATEPSTAVATVGAATVEGRLLAVLGLPGAEGGAAGDDVEELRMHARMWEAKLRALQEENRVLREGGEEGRAQRRDLAARLQGLREAHAALRAELAAKEAEGERLAAAAQELAAQRERLEAAVAEQAQLAAVQQDAVAAEAAAVKERVAAKEELVRRASDFVNAHYAEQNGFLAAQVEGLTALLRRIGEEDAWAAQRRAAAAAAGGPHDAALITVTSGERGEIAAHFSALLNSPARRLISPESAAGVARLIAAERSAPGMAELHALPQPRADLALCRPRPGAATAHEASLQQHYARAHGRQRGGDHRAPQGAAPTQQVRAPLPRSGAGALAPPVFAGYVIRPGRS